jgi:hypothetical protein
MYRGVARKGDVAIKAVGEDGRVRVALRPFDDLQQPGISKISLWDATLRPDGGVSYVGVAVHEARLGEQPRATQLMAHYSAKGVLTRVWDMHPYHHHLIAADRQNSIYAFGHRVTGDKKAPYPLLVQYTQEGAIRTTLLTAADIDESKEPDSFVDGGAHELLVVGNSVVLLLRPKNEVLEFRDGGRVRRSVADLAGKWLQQSAPHDLWAGMFTPELGGSGFLAYALAIPRLSESVQAGPNTSPAAKVLRVQPGLTKVEPVELVGGPGAMAAGGRLIGDEGEYLRFAAVQTDGRVKILLQRKVNSRK